MTREAMYREALPGGSARCALCPHHCVIPRGGRGRCGARENVGGTLIAANYACVTSVALDPIEKKPLARFYPGTKILSLGSYGCNLNCPFCQNHAIARRQASYEAYTPERVAEMSLRLLGAGNIGVAYTYNEPAVGYEFVLDTARLVAAQGQKNVLVTNGFIEEAPLLKLLPFIDAMNIDLKGFTDDYYRWLGGRIEPVKRSILLAARACHVEVTTLIVPGRNDAPEEMEALSAWLGTVNESIPLHITRFFPRHEMPDAPPTPIETMRALLDVARAHLNYVFLGNV